MKTRCQPNAGFFSPLWVVLVCLLVLLALLAYMFVHLLRIPPRQLPREAENNLLPFIAEQVCALTAPAPSAGAPPGWKWKSVQLLTSTNLTDWERVDVELNSDSTLSAPDGSLLTVEPVWDEEIEQTTGFKLILINPGTEAFRFYKLP
jgi:hypothetical protein